ncbi:MAG TPA: efflux transporter outer membrane subunit [Chitinophaga sp.]
MRPTTQYICCSLLAALLTAGSCRMPQPVATPAVKALPGAFPAGPPASGNSSDLAAISWRQFFPDPQLVALIDTTLHNNPDLWIAQERITIARAQLALKRAALAPAVNGALSAAADRYGDYTMNGVGNYDTNLSPNIDKDQRIPTRPTWDYFLGFRSSWELDIWGKLKDERKAASALLLATEKGRQYAITTLVAEVAGRYYHLLALDNEQAILQRNILLQQSALDVVKVQKEAGRATELAVHQFKAQLLHTQALQYATQQAIAAEQYALNLLAGRYPQDIPRDSSFLRQPLPGALQTGLPSVLLTRRPDIQQAELELMAAKASVSAARKAFLPSLSLTPYLGLNAFSANLLFDGGSLAAGALAGLTTPIFAQHKLKAGYSIASAAQRQAVYHYQQVLLQSFTEVLTQLDQIRNSRAGFALKQQEVSELTEAVATVKDLYLTGYANYLEVITAQKGVLEAELSLVGERQLLFQSVINLYRALGGGWY